MVDYLPPAVWITVTAISWAVLAVITWHEHVVRRRATRHQS